MGSIPESENDWINASRFKIMSIPNERIMSRPSKTGEPRVVWDYCAHDFLADYDEPPTDVANASLWRQSRLCYEGGLFQVISSPAGAIYQVRTYDVSNMTIVEIGSSGEVIVIDPLTSVETAKAAFEMYANYKKEYNPDKHIKVKALIYTHSHADHFGGAEAIMPYAASKDIPIYAPEGFLEHAVSENVYAGNAMTRRSVYMYGESLDIAPNGHIGVGLGLAVSQGTSSLVAPTHYIKNNGKLEPEIEGMELICQLTPGTEAPSEMNFYFPSLNALCMAENATHTLHNLQTLRGAPVRDARLWSRYLDEAIALFGEKTEVVFSSHHWPTWETYDEQGNPEKKIISFMSRQRDCYAYLHNETLRRLNNGMTPVEIAEVFELPPSLRDVWDLKGYYGSVSHNVKAIYDKYMGWFDGNPANLWKHPPKAEAARYVQCMGGYDKVVDLAQGYIDNENDLRFAATLLNHAVFSDPNPEKARVALAHVYRKLGHGAENGTWRNIYLTGAKELVGDVQPGINLMAPEAWYAFSLDELVDTMAIRVEGPKAWGKAFTINLMVQYPAKDGKVTDPEFKGYHVRLSNGALTGHVIKYQGPGTSSAPAADLTLYVTHQELVQLFNGERSTIEGLNYAGDAGVWDILLSLLTIPNTGFNIVKPLADTDEPMAG
ncbi:hypothetical protein ETB97_005703 [Aspergillus alliaceus]|uniref:Metallo-beta-lactamase domain-containing protein n=1 Tax=Petromyces alliaceus TaxID=209559 RepID=A0A8H6E3Y8_PETAA|nr:hypothetical protein ETB97_005703 [Aspergillus burnettii]